jgi:hypothetical protein
MTDTRDMVSVAIVTKGRADELLDLTASILPQLNEGDEILIMVDPPSTNSPSDMTREIADEIAHQVPCARVLLNEHPGETAGYEQVIRACQGTYIFLAEPGDIWKPDKVGNVLDAFAMSGSILILHDSEVLDATRRVLAPSLFELHGSRPGFQENLLNNAYLGSALAFLEPFKEFFLPFPPEVTRHDQWMGLIAERFGGVALITKPLIGKMLAPEADASATLTPRELRDRRRGLLKALKKRERELVAMLRP